MTYRPYPNADRARAQLDRHVHDAAAPVIAVSPATAEWLSQVATAMRAIRVPAVHFPAARPEGSST